MMGAGGDKLARQDMFPTRVAEWRTEPRVGSPAIGSGSSFDVRDHPVGTRIRELAALRKAHPALADGPTALRLADGPRLVVSRFDLGARREYVTAFNAGTARASVTVQTATPGAGWDTLVGAAQAVRSTAAGRLTLSLAPLEAAVLRAQADLPARAPVRPALVVRADELTNLVQARATVATREPVSVAFAVKRGGGAWRRIAADQSPPFRGFLDPRASGAGSGCTSSRSRAGRPGGRPSRAPSQRCRGRADGSRSLESPPMAAPVDDPGGRPDATGRRLEYLPAAVIGNGSLLVTLSARGEVERLLWPHVDGPNAIVELRLGLLRGDEADAAWLDEDAHSWAQAWAGESSVLRTTATTDAGPVLVEDAVDPDEPVLVRRVEGPRGVLVVTCAPRLGGDTSFTGAFVDPESRAVVFHRRDMALAIATDCTVKDAGVEPADGPLDDVAHVGPVRGRIEVEHAGGVHVVVCFGSSPFEALARARQHAGIPEWAAVRSAQGRCGHRRPRARRPRRPAQPLLHRSVLVLEALADRAVTGGIVAAPEMDERFAESGGYGFVWPRDHSLRCLALLAAGRAEAGGGRAPRRLGARPDAGGSLAPPPLDDR